MNIKKVALIAMLKNEMPSWVTQKLRDQEIEFIAHECTNAEELRQYAGDADVAWIIGNSMCLMNGNLQALANCGAILRSGSGTDNIPVDEATQRGILVANIPQALSHEVAEHAIGLLLSVVRQTPIHDRLVRQGIWDYHRSPPNWLLHGRTLGLVGFGLIARQVARKLSGFEMKVLAYDPYVEADRMEAAGVTKASLNQVLSESDFVSVHCPLTPETHRLIGESEFRKMKKKGVFINTSRGPVVDEPVLVRALSEGWIAAAGLDVTEIEPCPPDHPLMKLDNVVITPHLGALSDVLWDSIWRHSVQVVVDLAEGRWPVSVVNRGVTPKWELVPQGV